MVGPSKILTVSYGTFSCTLEGFDEPFSTMKSIAEYFRDLAADDRYFGAEPPTPDAEMLHKIAEREVQRRVEARVQEDGIVLRQMEHQAPAAQSEPAADPVAPAEPEYTAQAPNVPPAPVLAEPDVLETAIEEPAFEDPAPVAQDDDSVAAKLSRIRAVVGTAAAGAAAEDPFVLPTAANDSFKGSIESAFADEYDDEAEAEAPHAEVEDDPAPLLDAAEELNDASEDAVEAEAEDVAEEVSFEPALEEDDASEDLMEAAPEMAEAEVEPELAEDDAEELVAADDTPEDNDAAEDDAFDMAAFALAHASSSDDQAEAEYEAEPVEAEFDASALHSIMADTAQSEGSVEDEAEEDISELDLIASDEDMADLEALDAAPEDQIADEEEDMLLVASDDADLIDSTLSEEDEAELMAELETVEAEELYETEEEFEPEAAAHEAEALSDDAEDEPADLAEDTADLVDLQTADVEADTEEAPATPSAGSDSAFERILEETNSKLDDTEGSRRRSAIAHLKAAVAATKADRMLNKLRQPAEIEAEEQSQYRDDLAKVVRPRRTFEKGETASARPAPLADRPAPLVLVSELRVDDESSKPSETAMPSSVLPRRVSMGNLALEEEDQDAPENADMVGTSFAEFAERMGASELPDLLEAAAAYSAFVEGNKHFSRPQIMRRVATFGADIDYSREAGLRSFGQLLRQGKIQKLRRGQFTIREDTRFNPEARMAGE